MSAATGGYLTGSNKNVKSCIACVHSVADKECKGCIACHFDWQGIDIANQTVLLHNHTAMLLFGLSCVVLPDNPAWSSWKV